MDDHPDITEAPTFLGMVLCDNVLQDPETKRYFLMGTVTVTYATSFPARYQKMCVYAALTGMREKTDLVLRLVHVDPEGGEDEEIMALPGTIEAPDPLSVAEFTLGIRNIMFQQPGAYRFQLWSGNTLLGERRLLVRQAAPQTPPSRRRRE